MTVFIMLYGHHLEESIVSPTAVGGINKASREKHLNFVFEIAHFGANAIWVRKISGVPQSEGERSIIPSNPPLVAKFCLLINFRFRRVLVKAAIEYSGAESSVGAALARARSAWFDWRAADNFFVADMWHRQCRKVWHQSAVTSDSSGRK